MEHLSDGRETTIIETTFPVRTESLDGRRPAALRAVRLGEIIGVVIFLDGAVDGLLKDGFGVIDFELGLEVTHVVGHRAAVGTAAGVVELEALVRDVITERAPRFTVST